MFKNKKKVLALTISALILLLSLGTSGYAQSVQATLKAQFVSFKILSNGSQVTPKDAAGQTVHPLLVNNSTYLPVRAFGDLFNKKVDFDNNLKQISISDKADSQVESLKAQLIIKDAEIKKLNDQITVLQAQLAAKEGDRSFTEFQKVLNKEYGNYEKLNVSITLSGSKSKISVTVDVGNKTNWNNLTSARRTKLLQNIVDDLIDEYNNPTVSGTVKAGSANISSFTVSSGGTVRFSSVNSDLSRLERDLNYDYDVLGDIDELNIELDGDDDLISFTVYVDYDYFKREWDRLSDSNVKYFMEDIHTDILYAIEDIRDFRDASVAGTIIDSSSSKNNTMATLTRAKRFTRATAYSR